ncbi:MAG: hypothetical protein RL769_433, partial [Pseudomonadota bacterium]
LIKFKLNKLKHILMIFSKDQISSQQRRLSEISPKKTTRSTYYPKGNILLPRQNSYLTVLAMLGFAESQAMLDRQNDYLKKTKSSRALLSQTKSALKYRYELPKKTADGKEISGKWLAIFDQHLANKSSSRFVIDPSKMPVSLKRILTSLILRSSPFIQDLISKEGFDLLAIFDQTKISKSLSEQESQEIKITQLFNKLIDNKFRYFAQVKKILQNFLQDIENNQLPSALQASEKEQLSLILREFKSANVSSIFDDKNQTANSTSQSYKETSALFNVTSSGNLSQANISQANLSQANLSKANLSSSVVINSGKEKENFESQINEFRSFLVEQRLLRESFPNLYPKLISLQNTKFFGIRFCAPEISFEPDLEKSSLKNISKEFLKKINFANQFSEKKPNILKDLDLRDVDLTGIDLDNFILENCILRGAIIPSARNLQIIGCDLTDTKWFGSQTDLMIGHNRFNLNQQIIFVRNALSRLQYSKMLSEQDKARILFDLTNLFVIEIYRTSARDAITTKCLNADFSQCQINGLIALKVDFKGTKFPYLPIASTIRNLKFYGRGVVFFGDCQNLDLAILAIEQKQSLQSFDFEVIKEKYQKIYGKEIVELILKSFGDFQNLPAQLVEKLSTGKKITIVLAFANSLYPENLAVEFLASNLILRERIAKYLNELFDQQDIEFVVKERVKDSSDYTIKIGDFISEQIDKDLLDYKIARTTDFSTGDVSLYLDRAILLDQNLQRFNSRYISQALIAGDVLFDINDPNYFEDIASLGQISAFTSSSASIDSLSIVSDGKVENIVLDPFFEQWLKPADYLSVRMYLEALGRFSEKQITHNDLLINVTALEQIKSGMIFQKSPQSLNAFTISDDVAKQCQKISVHKAKDLVKYCYFFHEKDCRDNSFIGQDDQAILVELKTGEKKLIILSGGQQNITIGYTDKTADLAEEMQGSDFDKSKLGYLVFLAVLTIPCLVSLAQEICLKKSSNVDNENINAILEFADGINNEIKEIFINLNLDFLTQQSNNKFKIANLKQCSIDNFNDLSNFYIPYLGCENLELSIFASIFNDSNLSIKILEISKENLNSESLVIGDEEKLKLIVFENSNTREKKFALLHDSQNWQISFDGKK